MKKSLVIAVLISASNLLSAQQVVALHHTGTTQLFNTLNPVNDAVAAAQNGDTIYIPGTSYSIGSLIIDKSLTIFGVGHYADSTQATGITNLSGNISLISGADNSFLQGFYLTGDIILGTVDSNDLVNNISISRINFKTLKLSYNGVDTNSASGIVIQENWIRNGINGGYLQNVSIDRNLVYGAISYLRSSLFNNNIMFYTGSWYYHFLTNLSNCLFTNNIIAISGPGFLSNCYSNSFTYNAFSFNISWPQGSNTGSNNWYSTAPNTLMVNVPSYALNYTYDYHLQTPSLFLGSDATPIGIYGTTIPYKEGAVPKNPHIQSATIADTTNNSGLLQIDIKVGAQQK